MTFDKSPETIQTMFNMIANRYDFINNAMSFGTQLYVKTECVKKLKINPHDNILDLCCGTGDFAGIIKKINPQTCIMGIDFSENMLNIARKKYPQIQFLQGDATSLPYEDNSFDIVTMGFGLRNIQNAEKAVEEIHRVLKPNGQFLHLDFGEKNLISKIYDKITPFLVSRFTDNAPAYSYLIKSRQIFPIPSELIEDFERKGFKLKIRKDYFGSIISFQIMTKL